MNKKKVFKLFSLSILGIGIQRMNTNQFKYYGLLFGENQIKAYISLCCKVISSGTEKEASLLLAETIAVESDNGNAVDYSSNYGEGLTQFDKGTFEDIKQYYSKSNFQDLRNRIKFNLLVNIENADYTDLRKSPMLSIVFARLLYLRVPKSIPYDKKGRWEYYKKYFNSSLGATTEAKYYNASQKAVYV